MNEINFYNKERILIMQFKNFQITQTGTPSIITFTGVINFDFFHVETDFEAEEYDFKKLLLSIKKIYTGQQKHASFNPLSPKIRIELLEYMGQIEVKVEICNNLYTGDLKLKYIIDQSFLPELVDEISSMLDNKIQH